MNRHRLFTPWAVFALLWVAFAAYVWITSGQLPDRVATHFGAAGQPNGWMTRAEHVQFTLVLGAVVPAFVLGIFSFIGRLNGRGLNIPHKDYWLAPEQRAGTFEFMRRQGAWFAGLFIVFLAGIHTSILAANAHRPIHLPLASVAWVAGPFLAAAIVWVIAFFLRFSRRPA